MRHRKRTWPLPTTTSGRLLCRLILQIRSSIRKLNLYSLLIERRSFEVSHTKAVDSKKNVLLNPNLDELLRLLWIDQRDDFLERHFSKRAGELDQADLSGTKIRLAQPRVGALRDQRKSKDLNQFQRLKWTSRFAWTEKRTESRLARASGRTWTCRWPADWPMETV